MNEEIFSLYRTKDTNGRMVNTQKGSMERDQAERHVALGR
jgi:hypothetical protein